MAYVTVPKDLTHVKSKVLFGLTKRQLVCFGGALRVLRAEGGILHYQRIGEAETAEIIVNRTEHIIVEPLASGKHTEVNPMGFTIVVEEVGHNPNHSYYDYK